MQRGVIHGGCGCVLLSFLSCGCVRRRLWFVHVQSFLLLCVRVRVAALHCNIVTGLSSGDRRAEGVQLEQSLWWWRRRSPQKAKAPTMRPPKLVGFFQKS